MTSERNRALYSNKNLQSAGKLSRAEGFAKKNLYWTLSILLDEKKLDRQLQNSMSQKEEVKIDMCKAIRELIADGRTEGILRGRLSALYELVQDGLLSVKDAAIKASMTENDFSIEMKKAGY